MDDSQQQGEVEQVEDASTPVETPGEGSVETSTVAPPPDAEELHDSDDADAGGPDGTNAPEAVSGSDGGDTPDTDADDEESQPVILSVTDPATREEALERAAEMIAEGECIVLPTDTVYGIGADAMDSLAVQRLLQAKDRGRDMPPPVLVSDPVVLPALCQRVPKAAEDLAHAFWPGGLTLILPAQDHLTMDLGETNGTIAVRVPDQDDARELLRRTGPMAVSSANKSGRPAALTAQDAADQLGLSVAVYLDAGPSPVGEASTIVDFVGSSDGQVLRQGSLSLERIHEVAPDVHGIEPAEPEPEPPATEPELESAEPEPVLGTDAPVAEPVVTEGTTAVVPADPDAGQDNPEPQG